MPEENDEQERASRGIVQNLRERMAAYADAVKQSAAAAWKENSAEIQEAIGPEKIAPVKQPERPFERNEGGADVKRIVWTGHTVETSQGQRHFGAVGLTNNGYYRAADVQQYGAEESWRWENERHTGKEEAIKKAQAVNAARLSEHDRLMMRSAAHASRDVLHDASAGQKPGAYTVQEARDRAAHTPSILDRDGPRSREEESRMIDALHKDLFPTKEAEQAYERHVGAGLNVPADAPHGEQWEWRDLSADTFAEKTAKENVKNMTPEQKDGVDKALSRANINEQQIGGASDPGGKPTPNDPTPVDKAREIGQDLQKQGVTMDKN